VTSSVNHAKKVRMIKSILWRSSEWWLERDYFNLLIHRKSTYALQTTHSDKERLATICEKATMTTVGWQPSRSDLTESSNKLLLVSSLLLRLTRRSGMYSTGIQPLGCVTSFIFLNR
jgi:hypothetical protein